uniref:P1 protease and VPg n=1 Tax=Green Sichuan pepper enamovirus TaxID=2802551 RepID=A0A8F3ERB1_9VIRU|nr:P1 protease and VPg [Green Sichuan pepper enamovirus]
MLKLIAALLLAIFLSGLWQTSLSSAFLILSPASNETGWNMKGSQHFSWSPTSFSCASDISEPWESSRAPPELKALLTSWTHPACAVWLTSETGSWSLLVNASMCLSRPLEALTSARGTLMSSLESFLIYMGGLLEIMLTNCFVALLGFIEISIGTFELLWRSYVLAVIYISWLLLKARPLMTATLVGTLCLFSWADGTHPFRFFLRLLMSPIRILGENFKSIVRLQKMAITQIMNLILMLLLLPLKVLNLKHQETWGVERLVEGWPKMFIFADPPKGCIAEVLNEDFERVGFCSCVRTLASQEIVLLIPHHLTYGVTEIRVGNRSMKFSDFKVVYSDVKGDAVMLAGPPGWNSKLGMRPRKLIPMSGLRRGKATLFFPGAPAWQAQAAQIKGVYKGFVRGTYHTLHGYSGLPLFNDALDIVAMHVGHYGDELTDNRATVVADLPGITILPFEMESIHMETRVLTGIDAVDQAAENYLSRPIKVGGKTINLEMTDYTYKKITSSALPVLGEVAWADDEDLNDPDLWMYAERKEVSGNGQPQEEVLGKQKTPLPAKGDPAKPSEAEAPLRKKKNRRSRGKKKAPKKTAEEAIPAVVETPVPPMVPPPVISKAEPVDPAAEALKTPGLLDSVVAQLDFNKIEQLIASAVSAEMLTQRRAAPKSRQRRRRPSKSTSGTTTTGAEKQPTPTRSPPRGSNGRVRAAPATTPPSPGRSPTGDSLSLRPAPGSLSSPKDSAGRESGPKQS